MRFIRKHGIDPTNPEPNGFRVVVDTVTGTTLVERSDGSSEDLGRFVSFTSHGSSDSQSGVIIGHDGNHYVRTTIATAVGDFEFWLDHEHTTTYL